MRKVVYASEAMRAFIVIIAALIVVSVFPLRLWQRDIVERAAASGWRYPRESMTSMI